MKKKKKSKLSGNVKESDEKGRKGGRFLTPVQTRLHNGPFKRSPISIACILQHTARASFFLSFIPSFSSRSPES